ncbi:MAG TPA: ferredoxin [Pseudonocardiaceae bacterium]|jgi:ferredoxin|nr:ferredoxin [Pseudonocardiaceae bacterium]
MRVIADREVCVGAGQCVLSEPRLFTQDATDGRVTLLTGRPSPEWAAAVRVAAGRCPARAISLDEE